ncbi:hypothetical protein V7x_51110 [Crateriforma conspicua]|uniref:Planctomycete cytochrome C n=1 Tax=Crateriforma conspicua TaxID=2527996 RepID=A0A5C6FT56_9PLAN|nr:DUF1592 domain-containing protein [Crateriforma conspicua]TWU63371.1 hypothetical protein V7x_51110 [Crateriforma conspicua]
MMLPTAGSDPPSAAGPSPTQPISQTHFVDVVRPLLVEFCGDCHHPEDADDPVGFLRSKTAAQIQHQREIWSSVAQQLNHRTMPPADADQPSESQRLQLARWIEDHLRTTACTGEEYAGSVQPRRLNRDQYTHAINDLTGLDFDFVETFPADGSGGEGFDNNAETLFLPPLLMERYLEVAGQVADRLIVTPPPLVRWSEQTLVVMPTDRDCGLLIRSPEGSGVAHVLVTVDGRVAETVNLQSEGGHWVGWILLSLTAGPHQIRLDTVGRTTGVDETVESAPAAEGLLVGLPQRDIRGGQEDERQRRQNSDIYRRWAIEHQDAPDQQCRVALDRLAIQTGGSELRKRLSAMRRFLGQTTESTLSFDPKCNREQALQAIDRFARLAWRRPLSDGQRDRLAMLIDRGLDRGDGILRSMKLPLIAILVSPNFLFFGERSVAPERIVAVSEFELASRLSFFLWHSLPDETLLTLAESGQLSHSGELRRQVDRMIADPRSVRFAESFAGQWLGTVAVGNTKIPDTNFFKPAYNPMLVRSLRAQVGALMHHMMRNDRPIIDWIDADYVIVNDVLARHYRIGEFADDESTPKPAKGRWGGEHDDVDLGPFYRLDLSSDSPDRRRAGVLGLGAVHMLTSYSRRTSPVLRGGWVLETLLGARVPSPPPDAGQLPGGEKEQDGKTVRERLQRHRQNPTCAACHDLIDPIGFAMECFDVLGRYRESESQGGQAIDTSGRLPDGTTFEDVNQLRTVLRQRHESFAREYVRRLLGYALARSLEDADSCTIESLVDQAIQPETTTADLIHAVVQSLPFRFRQGPAGTVESVDH